jgi:hypothetical protein
LAGFVLCQDSLGSEALGTWFMAESLENGTNAGVALRKELCRHPDPYVRGRVTEQGSKRVASDGPLILQSPERRGHQTMFVMV